MGSAAMLFLYKGEGMEKFDKIFRQFIMVAGILWLGAAAMHLLEQNMLFILLGALSVLLSVKNIIILNVSSRTGNLHPKIEEYVSSNGLKKGLLYYGVFNVLTFLVLGIILIVTSI